MFTGLVIAVFIIGYLLITLEHKIGINKTAIALLTAVICWTLLALAGGGHDANVEQSLGHHLLGTSQIVFFLIGAMAIVHLMEMHGAFNVVARLITTTNKTALLWIVAFITFFLSAVLDNLTTSIVMVSLMHRLIDDREDRMIFASMIIIAANAGGAWSPIGDVTTTMLWIGGQISAQRIVQGVFWPSLVSIAVPLVWFARCLKPGRAALKAPVPAADRQTTQIFLLGLGALLFVPVFKIVTGLPPFVGILLGLGVMWLVTDLMHGKEREHLTIPKIFRQIDLASVIFFLGILLAVSALDTAGVLQRLSLWLDQRVGNLDLIATFLGIGSAIVDNVPLTAAAMGMYDLVQYPMDHRLWEMLAYAVGTGGSILIIGSAAGVVVMGMEKITFGWYLVRVSLPVLLGYLAGIGTYILMVPR